MGKLIGVLNQKGGVGKSTITGHLAMSLYHSNNFEKDPLFVSIYDADMPQWSIINMREEEVRILQSLETDDNLFYTRKLEKLYNENFKPINIYKGDLTELSSKIPNLKKNFEYTFVDVVGTVNTEGYTAEFLESFDFIIIPTSSQFESLRSTMSFVENIVHPLSIKSKLRYSILINDVPISQQESYLSLIDELRKNNYEIFSSVVNSLEKYVRLNLHYKGKNGLQSTFFPTYDKQIDKLTEEFLNKINHGK